ncbi:MAG: hypothetical protein EBX37_01250 [Alphaproteobacteria bacterium]|nr:hypothetical protein [Alphaproteobacteria bacterium]
MREFRPLLMLLLLVFLLPAAGCQQAQQVRKWATGQQDYELLPPDTVNGRKCAALCPTRKQQCENLCVAENNTCRHQLKITAERQHRAYVEDQLARGQLVQKTAKDFWNEAVAKSCQPIEPCKERCAVGLRYCHSQCGGKVIKGDTCYANCEKIPDEPAPMEPDWL